MVKKINFILIMMVLLVFSFLFSINFVSARHIVNVTGGATTFYVLEDVPFTFNISINNSDFGATGQYANITQVNITLPGNFSFNPTVNGTSALGNFSNLSNVLTWSNSSYYLINASSTFIYFWFNATPSVPGTYNLSVRTLNKTGTSSFQTNLTIVVNDSTAPVINLISPVPSTSETLTEWNFTFNVTDDSTVSNCSLIFDGSIIQIITGVNNSGAANGMFNSSLSVAVHTWSVNCTDSANNIGNSSSIIIVVNAAAPAATSSGGGGSPPEWTSTKVLTDAEFSSGIIKELRTKERVKVNVGSDSHYIGVKELTSTTVKIEISSTPQTAVLNIGEEKKFDVNGDGSSDISVKLNSITSNIASITFKTITEKIAPETIPAPPVSAPEPTNLPPAGNAAELNETGNSFGLWIIIAIIVIIIIAIIYYFIAAKNNKKNFSEFKKKKK